METCVKEVCPMARLSDPITILKGVGPTKAKQFAALNIYTLEDLICHFPGATTTAPRSPPSKSCSPMSLPALRPW